MAGTRVLIVDDQRIFRVMLHEVLSAIPGIELVGEAASGQEAVDLAASIRPEVILMDIELGSDPNGIQAGHAIKARMPNTGIVLFSTYKSKEFIVNAPGWSYLLKNNVEDIDTLTRAINGATWGMTVVDPEVIDAMRISLDTPLWRMSPEPVKVLELMAQGYDNATIAQKLLINERAVEEWQDVIYHNMGIEREEGVDPRIKAVAAYLSQTDQAHSRDPESRQTQRPGSNVPLASMSEEHRRVLELLARGRSNRAIAEQLHIDERSVQEYLDVTYHEMGIGADPGVDPRVTLVLAYLEQVGAQQSVQSVRSGG